MRQTERFIKDQTSKVRPSPTDSENQDNFLTTPANQTPQAGNFFKKALRAVLPDFFFLNAAKEDLKTTERPGSKAGRREPENEDRNKNLEITDAEKNSANLTKDAEKHSDTDSDSPDCIVCFGPFQEGDKVRRLRCEHVFHAACVDQWLLGHQNKCPMCSTTVGPRFSEEDFDRD